MGLEATVSKFALWAGLVVVVAVAPSRAFADGDASRPPRTGMRHFETGNYDGARTAWERDADGDHDVLTVHMLSVHRKLAAPRDEVIAKLEEVIATTPDDYEYHLKAKKLLKQLPTTPK